MGTLWFWIVTVMLAAYVVLDGFDLGVGILFPFVARTEDSGKKRSAPSGRCGTATNSGCGRRRNAVLCLSAGVRLVVQRLLHAVDDCLVAADPSRPRHRTPVAFRRSAAWRSFFDVLLFFPSAMLAIVFGAALVNVIRGVPLGSDSYFYLPLWTNWCTRPGPGILDWYTVVGGVLSLVCTLSSWSALSVAEDRRAAGTPLAPRRGTVASAGNAWDNPCHPCYRVRAGRFSAQLHRPSRRLSVTGSCGSESHGYCDSDAQGLGTRRFLHRAFT